MSNKSDNQSVIISEIKRVEKALGTEIRKAEKNLRSELKRGDRALREEMLRVEERLENKIDKVDQKLDIKFDKVLTDLSNFAGRVQDLETENKIGSDQIRRLDERLTALEPTT